MNAETNTQRDELAAIIDRGEHYYDTGSHYELSASDAADAVLAAGYRKPRTITTVEELDALPVGSTLRLSGDDLPDKAAIKISSECYDGSIEHLWLITGTEEESTSAQMLNNGADATLTLIYTPEAAE